MPRYNLSSKTSTVARPLILGVPLLTAGFLVPAFASLSHSTMRRTALLTLLLWLAVPSAARAQSAAEPSDPTEATTLLPRPDGGCWWLSGQLNVIWQGHGTFTSPYRGDHSLLPDAEHATSHVWTLYTGVRLPRRTQILVDLESAGGRGISDALGLAGFTNLDVVRNPTLGSAPYLARLIVHHTIALGSETIKTTPGPLSLETEQPATRLELRAGKLSIVDFFDLSAVGSDSHLQFTNWTIDNNGAYDYAADTRGTRGAPSWITSRPHGPFVALLH
jgi:high affinity Mn2+ porin